MFLFTNFVLTMRQLYLMVMLIIFCIFGTDARAQNDFEYLYNKGVVLYNKGDANEALKYFLKASTVNPNEPNTHYQIGFAYLALGNNQEATRYFEQFIKLDPNGVKTQSAREILRTLK